MRGWRGLLGAVLGLSALYAAVSTPQAAGRAGGLLDLASAGLRRLTDPGIAGVANHAGVTLPAGKPSASTIGAGAAAGTPRRGPGSRFIPA